MNKISESERVEKQETNVSQRKTRTHVEDLIRCKHARRRFDPSKHARRRFDPSRGSQRTIRAASKTIVQLEKWIRESLGTLQFHVEFVRAPVDQLRLPELVHMCLKSLRSREACTQ